MADVFCTQEQPDFVQQECGIELGGIVAIGLINSDQNPTDTNLETAAYWTGVLDDSPQKYFVIQDTRGSYPGGTPVEEEGYGRVPTQRTGADHEATIEVRGVKDNRGFWATVNKNAKWHVVLVTNGNLMLYLRNASIYAKIVSDQSIKSTIRWSVSIKWSDDLSNPHVLNAPTAIFGS